MYHNCIRCCKTYIKECKLVCPKCGYGFSVTCDHNRNLPFEKCVNPSCREARLMPDPRYIGNRNIQTVFLNEPLEESVTELTCNACR